MSNVFRRIRRRFHNIRTRGGTRGRGNTGGDNNAGEHGVEYIPNVTSYTGLTEQINNAVGDLDQRRGLLQQVQQIDYTNLAVIAERDNMDSLRRASSQLSYRATQIRNNLSVPNERTTTTDTGEMSEHDELDIEETLPHLDIPITLEDTLSEPGTHDDDNMSISDPNQETILPPDSTSTTTSSRRSRRRLVIGQYNLFRSYEYDMNDIISSQIQRALVATVYFFKPTSLSTLLRSNMATTPGALHIIETLDAPMLGNDSCANIIDWSTDPRENIVSILDPIDQDDSITCLSWDNTGKQLAVGTNDGFVKLWDVEANRKIVSYRERRHKLCAMTWNSRYLVYGRDDGAIMQLDTRDRRTRLERQEKHDDGVTCLSWNSTNSQLASGGKDGIVRIWDDRQGFPLRSLAGHIDTVRSLAWSSREGNLLATGGDTDDHHIRLWNTEHYSSIGNINAGSQVLNLAWSSNNNELVYTRGRPYNDICIQNYRNATHPYTFTGHSTPVAYMAISSDGCRIATGSSGGPLCIWQLPSSSSNNPGADN
ncbi:WD40-repeat-containing domain protein [Syncephalis plumigaleata]|nr:WD40-repeat-containing domain protein [Syncephalis plumigaleata]